jgi:16S rRNA (uracil1498-N3)-methyltransferase
MRLHRFFIHEPIGEQKEITLSDEKLVHQLRNVFRFKSGDSLVLFDNSGSEYVSEIKNITSDEVSVTIIDVWDTCFSPKKKVNLCVSIIKKDNFEWILEKCTEVGVTSFTPVISERTEKKNIDIIRANKILQEASEQSGRCTLPILNEIISLENVLKRDGKNLIAFDGEGEMFIEKFFSTGDVSVLIGPEGGWSDKEISLMKTYEVKIVSLGKQTLRAETAAVAISSLLLLK